MLKSATRTRASIAKALRKCCRSSADSSGSSANRFKTLSGTMVQVDIMDGLL